MNTETINELFGIKESFELPDKLMSILFDEEKKSEIFSKLLNMSIDLKNDIFRDYFQEEHSNRSSLKQDYTPDGICQLISSLIPETNSILDVCSGTGSLNISLPYDYVQCEELSARVLPILLLNLSIRNRSGYVLHKDVLSREILNVYKLTSEERFSNIQIVNEYDIKKFDVAVSNPPYSVKWQPIDDERFFGFDIPPKSKGDYAFVLDILSRLSDTGKAFIVLPHGVLFRGAREQIIRRKLIENNLIDTIIGLPDKLFLNTSIPVIVLVLNKNKNSNDVLFIDSSKQFKKVGKNNVLTEEHIKVISEVYHQRQQVEKYSKLVSFEEISKNDFNLNIPRYVDTFEKEKVPQISEIVEDIEKLNLEIKENGNNLADMILQMEGDSEFENYKKRLINLFRS